ncbi:MAG: hypothetical protein P9M08_10810 [Candidatus Erginobacter occultus]|nr:hypothetical protein [Candidatus Erginobacter occultus]
MSISEEWLRIVVGVIGGLVIVTRLYGVLNPKKMKTLAGHLGGLKPGWLRALYIIIALAGVWILYSALVTIFSEVPVFLVMSFLIGLLLLLSGVFIMHPEWFPQILKGLVIERNDFFVRFICFIGVLAGVFLLLTAIYGRNWGG